MVYSPLVKKACRILFDAHKDDTDKGGYPYVFHPFYLATRMEGEIAACVALMHDVVEDHGDRYSFETLREEGFPEEVIGALRLLTHPKGVPYMDYVRAIAENETAARVKMADLKHNMDTRRTDGQPPKKEALYREALNYLEARYGRTE